MRLALRALALLLWAAAGLWLLARPPALSSDDALFFLNGVTRFSILDFSPQFPGYPGFVLMARGIAALGAGPLQALSLLCLLIVLALPFAAAGAVRRGGGAVWTAFLLVLLQPLAPELALGLLSDGAGILFAVLALALLPREGEAAGPRGFWAGVAFGWALACRPSDLVLVAAAGAGAVLARPGLALPLLAGALAILLPVGAGLLILEPLYLNEAARFLYGHAEIWGNTALSPHPEGGWGASLSAHPLLAALLAGEALAAVTLLVRGRRSGPVGLAAGLAFWTHGIWVAFGQNPDNLRHLAPLLVFGGVSVALLASGKWAGKRDWGGALALLASAVLLLPALTVPPSRPAPVQAAQAFLAAWPGVPVITNAGVYLLRKALPGRRIYDAHYTGDAALGARLAPEGAFRLTSTRPEGVPVEVFPARFLGENTLYLFRIGNAQK